MGHAIIFISHSHEVKEPSDRVTVMFRWVVGTSDTSQVTVEEISRMMVGRMSCLGFPGPKPQMVPVR